MREIWKDVVNYEGNYQVSNFGRVRAIDKNGKIGKMLRFSFNKKTCYMTISLWKNNVSDWVYVHRLVAEVFLPNPQNLPMINHKNEIRYDNRVENLEWCDVQYNNEYSHGKPINQFDFNGNFIRSWKSCREVERELNYDSSFIAKASRGKFNHKAHGYIWKYIDKEGD